MVDRPQNTQNKWEQYIRRDCSRPACQRNRTLAVKGLGRHKYSWGAGLVCHRQVAEPVRGSRLWTSLLSFVWATIVRGSSEPVSIC